MKKCDVCGRRFLLRAKNRYVVEVPANLLEARVRAIYYNAFDCPHCGCQNIVGVLEKERVEGGTNEHIE